jgi:hypothetical protein
MKESTSWFAVCLQSAFVEFVSAGELIGTREMGSSLAAREGGIESCLANRGAKTWQALSLSLATIHRDSWIVFV